MATSALRKKELLDVWFCEKCDTEAARALPYHQDICYNQHFWTRLEHRRCPKCQRGLLEVVCEGSRNANGELVWKVIREKVHFGLNNAVLYCRYGCWCVEFMEEIHQDPKKYDEELSCKTHTGKTTNRYEDELDYDTCADKTTNKCPCYEHVEWTINEHNQPWFDSWFDLY
ncbi:hypothetical protein B0J14DRAFT_561717 [Halenospora varia]|nr:hypothetical protein B0J14DRAFT_561717 [Halenospora varia]